MDAATPKMSMGVLRAWRGRGVGSALLGCTDRHRAYGGLTSLSLSVEQDNVARHLYERVGFRRVGEVGGSSTMLLRL